MSNVGAGALHLFNGRPDAIFCDASHCGGIQHGIEPRRHLQCGRLDAVIAGQAAGDYGSMSASVRNSISQR